MAVTVMIMAFWDGMPCSLVDRSGVKTCVQYGGKKILETIYSTSFVFITCIFFNRICLACIVVILFVFVYLIFICYTLCVFVVSYVYLVYLRCICCILCVFVVSYVYLLYSYVYLLYLCVFVVLLCVFVVLCVS